MRTFTLCCLVATIGATATLLAACGGSQSTGAPVATGSNTAIAPARANVRLRPLSSSFEVLYRFGGAPRGAEHPSAGLVDLNGTLYGTTAGGGPTDHGTVYAVSSTGAKRVIYRFRGGTDGAKPLSGLISVGRELYGTTFEGGNSGCRHDGCGTVYKVSSAGVESVLYRFAGGSDGESPSAGLLALDGSLYGTTTRGGSGCPFTNEGCGTVYRISLTGSEKILYRFDGDGAFPGADLIDVGGKLYGTTYGGGKGGSGTGGCGVVYSVSTDGMGKVLYQFAGSPDGQHPAGPLINVNGMLYGTTAHGGTNGKGTVFTITPSGSENVLLSFAEEALPQGGFINIHGKLYGTTASGGSYAGGTVYSITTTTGTLNVLHNFANGSDGRQPVAPLIEVNGMLYGTTANGGVRCGLLGCGTVFALSP